MLSRPMLDRTLFFGISWYAVLIVAGILIGYALSIKEARRYRLPEGIITDFLLLAIPFGIIGARLYYVLFRFNNYAEDLLSIFNLREGGLAIYGGIIGGIIAVLLVSRRHKVSTATLLDTIAPSLVLAQGIGRWGNYINMEAYGLRVQEEALQFFPFAVEIPVGGQWYWCLATFFYEFCLDMLVFLILWFGIRTHRRTRGDVFRWYLLLYCSGRCVIEGLRSDSLTFISDFVRISQVLSAIVVLFIILDFFARIRDRISLVTIMPVISVLISIAVAVTGEFERGAYSTLFPLSQLGLIAILLSQFLLVILWTQDSGHFEISSLAIFLPNALFLVFLLVYGIGRENADNTYYVSLRQTASMIQCVLCGWMLCYHLCPERELQQGGQEGGRHRRGRSY